MNSMRQSGKINLLTLAFVAIIGMIVASLFFAKEDPQAVGGQFMDALARHDADKLTELSYTGKTDPGAIEAEKKRLRSDWDFCVNTAGKHFPFFWRITNSVTADDTHASVTVQVSKGGPQGYEEKYELPLIKEGGKWVVEAGSVSRTMFPALPR